MKRQSLGAILNGVPLLLLACVVSFFAWQSAKFLTSQNLLNILQQASSTTIAATGMTVVLLTAGVDLGVGSVMMLAVAVAGKLVFNDWSFANAALVAIAVGLLAGIINALSITMLRVIPFIATLAMLFVARTRSLAHQYASHEYARTGYCVGRSKLAWCVLADLDCSRRCSGGAPDVVENAPREASLCSRR